jgi:hypothetical protein
MSEVCTTLPLVCSVFCFWSKPPLKADYTSISIYGSTALCWTLAAFQFLNLFHTVSRTPWTGDQLVGWPLPKHRTTQTQNIRTQTSMTWVGFETTILVFERAKTVHALDARPLWSTLTTPLILTTNASDSVFVCTYKLHRTPPVFIPNNPYLITAISLLTRDRKYLFLILFWLFGLWDVMNCKRMDLRVLCASQYC